MVFIRRAKRDFLKNSNIFSYWQYGWTICRALWVARAAKRYLVLAAEERKQRLKTREEAKAPVIAPKDLKDQPKLISATEAPTFLCEKRTFLGYFRHFSVL